ncbi:MAG: AAA family ATPase [Butyrivibrio sp.]|nr:AAA family ATPase [Butyrivibrio sp.]
MSIESSRMSELRAEIELLPKGNITYKNIRGKRRMYLQWYEDGIKKSVYVKKADEDDIEAKVNRRKELERELRVEAYVAGLSGALRDNDFLQEEKGSYSNNDVSFEMRVVRYDSLAAMCKGVEKYDRRECFELLDRYLGSDTYGKVCLIYGLRRTGKTTLVLQAISDLPLDETAYIKALSTDTMAMLNRDLRKLEELRVKYVFIDEVTLISDFIDSASLLSDVYSMTGMKIILSGTDSLGLILSTDDELYDRSFTIHTTFIPFREYSRLLGKNDIDEYIRYGGTLRAGETNFDDNDLMDEGASFRDDESARRYIDTAIARNIQHSLACYKSGGHFRHLLDLYENGELTGAINRIIEDMNHRFLLSVLEKDFVSHDLGSARQIDRKKKALEGKESVLDHIDELTVVNKLREILDIKNSDERIVPLDRNHVAEIKEYLYLLDLIMNCESESIEGMGTEERILFTQPGMRYCQAQALVFSLMKDEIFSLVSARERGEICDRILGDVRGRMLEEIVLLETVKTLPAGQRAFKLVFPMGEFDMVILDEQNYAIRLYEIKHSEQIDSHQYRHLVNKDMCQKAEFKYGTILDKTVLYRGTDTEVNGIKYRNVEKYLMELGARR